MDRKSYKVTAGQQLLVRIPVERHQEILTPQKLPLHVLWEDEHMIVLNKAADMVVHPAAGHWDNGTVVHALLYYLQHESPFATEANGGSAGESFLNATAALPTEGVHPESSSSAATVNNLLRLRPGIVHRLDKGTTGVLVVGKTAAAVAELSQQFADRTVRKTYLAVTVGNPGRRVVIDKPIGRHPVHRQRMRVVPVPNDDNDNRSNGRPTTTSTATSKGRRALSLVDTLAFDGKLSLVRVRIETGRTHQIRVHLQDRHTPIYGDSVYGLSDWNKRLQKQQQSARR